MTYDQPDPDPIDEEIARREDEREEEAIKAWKETGEPPLDIDEALAQLKGKKYTPIEEHESPYGPPGPDDMAPWIVEEEADERGQEDGR